MWLCGCHCQDSSYDPWGKGVGQPEYDQYGDLRRHPNTRRYEGVFTDKNRTPPREEVSADTVRSSHSLVPSPSYSYNVGHVCCRKVYFLCVQSQLIPS